MADEKKKPQDQGQERRFSLRNIFYHNTFVLIFSFTVALVAWFVMAAGDTESNIVMRDVPIAVQYSPAAEEDGLRVFNMSYNTADLEISGNSLITNKLNTGDFDVTVTLNPTSTKLTGNTLQKVSAKVRAVKKNTASDYSIVTTNPEEVVLEYDRYKEVTLPIENEIKYSADTGYAAGKATFSEERITISGPESAVNKISRAAVSYSLQNPLKADQTLSCPVRLFDQNNQEIADTAGLYLEMSTDTIEVVIPIQPKKTVSLVASTVHQPKGFSNSRITVEPAQIDIAGPQDVLSGIQEVTLDTPIDFAELDITQSNTFTLDISLPAGVRNLSAGESSVSQATVSINLNGYKEASVTVPAGNFQVTNQPAGKDISFSTQQLAVRLIGSEAQASKLTGDSLSVQADLTNFQDATGSVEVPVTVTISGSGADSCWVLGKYTVSMNISDADAKPALTMGDWSFSDAVNAVPQE